MKRFTDTEKWSDPWYRKLSNPAMQLWEYIRDKCDPIGIVHLDFDLASLDLKQKVSTLHAEELGDERLQNIGNSRYFITGFIYFQYGELSPTCPPHKKILQLIRLHELLRPSPRRYRFAAERIGQPLPELREQSSLGLEPSEFPDEPTLGIGELPPEAEYWNLVVPEIVPKVINFSPTRMRYLKIRRKDPFWSANFEKAVDKVITSDFCNGKNNRTWVVTFDFLLERPDAVAKIMEGQYDNRTPTPTNHRNSSMATTTTQQSRGQRAESIAQRKLAGPVVTAPNLPRQTEGT